MAINTDPLRNELVNKIKSAGYRVFIAKAGYYGFFTDDAGSRVVSFSIANGLAPSFYGNYVASEPGHLGSGWRLDSDIDSDFDAMFSATPPPWIVPTSITWRHATLDDHLQVYMASSKYTEV